MPTVAELDILIDATDRATGDLARIGALVDSMGEREIDVAVQALIDDALGDLAKVDGMAEALDGQEVEVKVKADTDQATRSLNGFLREMSTLGSHAVTASRNVRGLTAAAIALAPALVPIGVVGVAGLAAFSGAAVSAGAGLGLFGVIAGTVYGKVNDAVTQIAQGEQQLKEAMTDPAKAAAILKIETAYNALTPAQAGAVRAQIAFGKAWADFASQYEPAIFQMIQVGFEGILSLLPRLKPIMDGATAALADLETRAISALHNPVWTSFFSYLGRTAQPAITGIGVSIGNLATGFASLLMAFEPLTTAFVAGMVRMSEKFAAWAATLSTNRAFQEFIDYVRANTPVVLALIGQLAALFLNLVQALMPIGAVILPILVSFLRMINSFADAHPHITMVIVAFLALVAVVIALAGPIAAIVAAVKLLGAPLLYLAGLLPGVGGALSAVMGVVTAIIPWILRFAGVIGIAIAAGIALWQNWDLIKAKAQELWQKIVEVFNGMGEALARFRAAAAAWTADVNAKMTEVATKIGASMAEGVRWIVDGVARMATAFATGFARIVGDVVGAMARIVSSIVSGIASAVGAVASGIASMVATAFNGMARFVQAAIDGVGRFVGAIAAGAGRAAGAAAAIAGAVVSAVSGLAGRMYAAAQAGVSGFVSGIIAGVGRVAAAARSLAAAAARALPGSPAEIGPLSGRGYTLYRGQRLGEDLAAGIASRAALVAASTNRYADLIAAGLTANDARIATGVRGGGGALRLGGTSQTVGNDMSGGAAFNFTINNPVAEPTSVTTNKALQRVAALGLV